MPEVDSVSIGAFLKEKINRFEYRPKVYEQGIVQSYMDGVVRIDGLHSRYGELLSFENNAFGLAMELRENGTDAVMLGGDASIGSAVHGTEHVADICVGSEVLGRVIDPIGRPLDGKKLDAYRFRPVESPAPAIIQRSPVNQPLETGILAIDSMIPIGRGQRELIVGDRQTGKTAIALATMMNQKEHGVLCVYCAIGQKASTIAALVHTLQKSGAMDHTVIVASTASDPAAMQYLTPYAGCAIAEQFMYEGRDALIIYDDLSKHAVAYRTMSLLLRRPSGREAYPGDVFYLHSRLLERAAKLSPEMGGGSLTALPIVETVAGDISAYIPTNIISITDGQIYLESELFHAGVRPAVNVGLSVSRVGRAAQHDAMRNVSGTLRLDVAQYRDLAVFAQFGADIDASTRRLLQQGECLVELLKQRQDELYSLSEQTAILLAYSCDSFQAVPLSSLQEIKHDLIGYFWKNCAIVMNRINQTGTMEPEDKESLIHAAQAFAALQEEDGNANGN